MSPMFRSIAAFLLGLALTGCTQTMEPFHAPTAQAHPDARLRARITSARAVSHLRTSVKVGERSNATGGIVPLVISVTSHERVPVNIPSLGCALLYVVYDEHGTQVSESFTCGYDVPPPFTLLAGETVLRRMEWLAATHRYESGVLIEVPLPPGLYRVHAYLIPWWPLPWDTYLSAPSVVRLVGP